MIENFSVVRRATNLVDVLFPKQEGVVGYRLKAAPNFDVSFTTILTANIGAGYLDPRVKRSTLHSMPGTGHVRAAFDPHSFGGTIAGNPNAGISDAEQFWLVFAPLDAAGVEGTPSDPCLVLSPSQYRGASLVAFDGSAPASPLCLRLPRRSKNIVLQNTGEGSKDLVVSFSPGGGEVTIVDGASYSAATWGPTDRLYVSGETTFSVSFTVAHKMY